MLESSSLWLSKADAGGMVIIHDADRQRLGLARAARGSWFSPRTIEVYETEDESLVFSFHRRWSLTFGWSVHDAEKQHVGNLIGHLIGSRVRLIHDAMDRQLACVQEAGATATLIAPAGSELASFEQSSNEMKVTFAPELSGEPFTKMLILASAIAQLL